MGPRVTTKADGGLSGKLFIESHRMTVMPGQGKAGPSGCAAWISSAGVFQGSGFVACPGVVVTAAHILTQAGQMAADICVEGSAGSFAVDRSQIKLKPDVLSKGNAFHPYPDLAVLSVPQMDQCAGVVLSSVDAAVGDEMTAFGFSDTTPSPGIRLETLALRIAGPSGDFIRVLGDGVREGFSGSMVVGKNGLVYGILKASRSYSADKGGWYVPTAPLIEILGAVAQVDCIRSEAKAPSDADIVDALMRLPAMAYPEKRHDLLEIMGERLGLPYSFEVEDRSDRRDHLYRIVRRCRHYRDAEGALGALLSGLEQISPHDASLLNLRLLIGRIVGSREK
ncbi:trypsin-like peptidase domain-containing protein [Streptomyces sp. NPDC102409]|uniref:effector-associated domain 2-containing protein n=1 Tax=Streptomyces sp. NPDC102409 TaxID=3366172 RepID=UPI0038222786